MRKLKRFEKRETLYDMYFVMQVSNSKMRDLIVDHLDENLVGDTGYYALYENELHVSVQTNRLNRAVSECKKIANRFSYLYDYAINEGNGWRLSKVHHDILPHCSFATDGNRCLYVTYGDIEYSNGFNTCTRTIKAARPLTQWNRELVV